jgi:hypothetical protein
MSMQRRTLWRRSLRARTSSRMLVSMPERDVIPIAPVISIV